MSDQDQNPNENGQDPKPQDGTAVQGTEQKKEVPEGFVSKEQFSASQQEAIRLAKENEELKKASKPREQDLPEDKKKVFEYLSEYEQKKAEEAKNREEDIQKNLDKLHQIHGDFDNNKLRDFIAEYGIYDDDGNTDWNKGLDLFKKVGNKVTKKPETGTRTQDNPVEVDKVQVRGKGFHEIVQDFKGKMGFGG